jgi:Zn-dependent protease
MFRRGQSVKLIELFGIRIGVDPSWFIVLFVLIFVMSGLFRSTLHSSDGVAYATTVISALLLYVSLIVHELGHALTARAHGIEVKRIDLFLFGGLTQMSRDTSTPKEELAVAAAGPLATLGVVIACLGVDLAVVGPHRLVHAALLESDIKITPVLLSLSWLFTMNLLLLIFNLMPAFPLDGGRIARAVVWWVSGDRGRGTRVSARMGQGFAVLLAGFGAWLVATAGLGTGLWLLAVAYLIGQAARGALAQSAFTERIEGVRVADVMDRQPVAIPAETPVTQALDDFFVRYGWSWFPVIDGSGRFLGVARRERVEAAVHGGEGFVTVGSFAEAEEAPRWRVDEDRPLSELLSSESLGRFGALMAVDREGVLRGVITIEQVRRALQTAFGAPTA